MHSDGTGWQRLTSSDIGDVRDYPTYWPTDGQRIIDGSTTRAELVLEVEGEVCGIP